ncbi:unnamed protein product, partial [Owenia fusiformis]
MYSVLIVKYLKYTKPIRIQSYITKMPSTKSAEEKDGDFAGFFSTVDEHTTSIVAAVTGTIPSWIKGGFLRNGPGKFEAGKDKYNHWFDGLALLHRFDFDN